MATAAFPVLLSQPHHFFKTRNGFIPDMGLQLYTVRHLMATDPESTLKAIQAIGFKQVEGGSVLTINQLLPKVQNAGLILQSTFFPSAFITERWDLVEGEGGQKPPAHDSIDSLIEEAVKHDIRYLVLGYLSPEERQTLDDYRRVAERMNKMGEKCNQADIHLCYHHHSFEFKAINGTVPFDLLVDEFEPDKVHFELDVFWASIGGYNPVELLEKLSGRIKLLHLKDKRKGTRVTYDESKVKKKAFQELGDGVLDIVQILQTAEKVSVEQCFLEQDQSPDPMASIRQSMDYLHKIQEKL